MKELKVLRFFFLCGFVWFGIQFYINPSGWLWAAAVFCGAFFGVSFSKDVITQIKEQDKKI